jgi:type I restriction enzyme S subunit
MSQIGELISQLCPKGVDYVELEALFNLRKGENLTNDQAIPGEYPVITASRGSTFFHNDFNFDGEYITISSHGAYAGFVSFYNQKFWLGNNVYLFESKTEAISTRFYFHVLKSLAQVLLGTVNTGGIPYINAKDLKRLRVPHPPIAIQNEIVRILDTFTELEVELEAELEARKIQYESYRREMLLTGRHGAPYSRHTLGEISLKVTSGSTPLAGSERFYENGTIPWLRTQEVKFNEIWETEVKVTDAALKETGIKWIPENCVIIAISGATAGRSAVNKIPLTTNQHCCNFQIDPEVANYRYVFHWVAAHYQEIKSFGRGVRSDLSSGQLKQYPVNLPPLSEQIAIASVLDKFDQLTRDSKFGIPAEIAARRKQYEYYRNKLLSFKELEVA